MGKSGLGTYTYNPYGNQMNPPIYFFLMVISTCIPCESTHWFTNWSNLSEIHMVTKWTHHMVMMIISTWIPCEFTHCSKNGYTHMKPTWLLYEPTHMFFMNVISTFIPCELTHWFTNYSNAVETHMTTKWTHPYGIDDVNCNMDTMQIYPLIYTWFQEWLNSSETHMTRIWTHP